MWVWTYMGMSQAESKDLLRAFPSMYQLLPNKIFTRQLITANGQSPRLWLEFDRSQSGYPYTRDSLVDDPDAPAPLGDCTAVFSIFTRTSTPASASRRPRGRRTPSTPRTPRSSTTR